MTKLKYIVSIILLIAITVAFLFFLDFYKKTDIARQDNEIYQLEFQSNTNLYSATDMGWIISKGEYKYINEIENSLSDELILKKANENIKSMLVNMEETNIKDLLEKWIEDTEGCKITTSLFASYMDEEVITFNLISVWAKWGNVIFEEETGLIVSFVCYVDSYTDEDIENEDVLWNKKQVFSNLLNCATYYYDNLYIRSNCSEKYNTDNGRYAISVGIAYFDYGGNKEWDIITD